LQWAGRNNHFANTSKQRSSKHLRGTARKLIERRTTYNRLLSDPDAVTIDASPSVFTGNPITPERLYSFIPDAKIVVTTRNPTIRSYSDYWHFHRSNKNDVGMQELRDLSCNAACASLCSRFQRVT
jgi:hypothetical protein